MQGSLHDRVTDGCSHRPISIFHPVPNGKKAGGKISPDGGFEGTLELHVDVLNSTLN